MIIVDTNVISELMKPSPAPSVRRWARAQRGAEVFTTAITLAEIDYGIARLPAGRRRDQLRDAADEVFAAFDDRVLPFDPAAATQYARVVIGREELGLPIDGFDAQIAAICHARGAAFATRNVKDFAATGIDLINPWEPTTTPTST
ncbi:MAG: type II toxin-antitoxin system VapC family toxin [Solirubrobacteraceae bacterium]|nr:type II toxin-antitoxin system VapC family toxin [Solirubrobacteraceae bacterium]